MVAFEMVVIDELRDRDAKVALTKWYELVEALRSDGEHETFREGVRVGASPQIAETNIDAAPEWQQWARRSRFMSCHRFVTRASVAEWGTGWLAWSKL